MSALAVKKGCIVVYFLLTANLAPHGHRPPGKYAVRICSEKLSVLGPSSIQFGAEPTLRQLRGERPLKQIAGEPSLKQVVDERSLGQIPGEWSMG